MQSKTRQELPPFTKKAKDRRWRLVIVLLILAFVLLTLMVWWYFNYRIELLNN